VATSPTSPPEEDDSDLATLGGNRQADADDGHPVAAPPAVQAGPRNAGEEPEPGENPHEHQSDLRRGKGAPGNAEDSSEERDKYRAAGDGEQPGHHEDDLRGGQDLAEASIVADGDARGDLLHGGGGDAGVE
jgi:hypothetical protein